jgi:type I restriction enzyme R subunit
MSNEADTCRRLVVLQSAGWDSDPHPIAEQRTVTDGRVIPVGKGFVRKPPKRVDYLLRHNRDFPIAVVEAMASYRTAADAVQQARNYAEMLGLKFAYATNGADVIEIDYFTGMESPVTVYPTGLTSASQASQLLAPYNHVGGKTPRYYQQIAINRTIEAILSGKVFSNTSSALEFVRAGAVMMDR